MHDAVTVSTFHLLLPTTGTMVTFMVIVKKISVTGNRNFTTPKTISVTGNRYYHQYSYHGRPIGNNFYQLTVGYCNLPVAIPKCLYRRRPREAIIFVMLW